MTRPKNLDIPLLVLLILLILTNTFILLNVPVLRLVFGFGFYSVIPGVLILHILNLDKIKMVEKFILSWGLSISFLMFFGLLANYLYPLFDYTPLSTNSLVVSISIILFILIVTLFRRRSLGTFVDISTLNIIFGVRGKIFLILPAFFPALGIIGAHFMNIKENNIILITLYILIVLYIGLVSLKHEQVPEVIYAPIIFLISISILLLWGLRSNYILGADIHSEYYIFYQTFQNEQWQILINNPLDACLSISILPTIYQSFLGVDPEYTFKLFTPVLFSVSPLIIYVISKKYVTSKYAFLASLFFISQSSFMCSAGGPRTRFAILFFALAVMVLFSEELNEISRRFLFIVFALSCIVSHYSTTYIFFFVLLGMWGGGQISRIAFLFQKGCLPPLSKSHVNIGILIIMFVSIFFWYSQVTGVAFEAGIKFIDKSLISLQDFFLLESRESGIESAFGKDLGSKGIAHTIEFIFSWLSIAFIAIGVLTTLARFYQLVALDHPQEKECPPSFMFQRLDADFLSLSIISSVILVTSIAFPYVSHGYDLQRTFLQMIVVLSVFFVIGGITIAESLCVHKRSYLIVLLVLVPFFMCTTGVISQIFDDPKSIILSSEGDQFDTYYLYSQETFGAKWLKQFTASDSKIYSDNFGERRLISQGGLIRVPVYGDSIIERAEKNLSTEDGYIYLRHCAVVNGKLLDKNRRWHNITEYQGIFLYRNNIYSNGGSDVWL